MLPQQNAILQHILPQMLSQFCNICCHKCVTNVATIFATKVATKAMKGKPKERERERERGRGGERERRRGIQRESGVDFFVLTSRSLCAPQRHLFSMPATRQGHHVQAASRSTLKLEMPRKLVCTMIWRVASNMVKLNPRVYKT